MDSLRIENTEHPLAPQEVSLEVELMDEPGNIPVIRTTTIQVPHSPTLAAAGDPNGVWTTPKATLRTERYTLEGSLYPVVTSEEEGNKTIECVLLSGNAGWVQKLKERRMNELDTSQVFDHAFTLQNVVSSFSGQLPYCYYTADRGDELLPGERTLYEFRPALNLSWLLKEIFRQAGVKLISNTINGSAFAKYFVVFEPDDNPRQLANIVYNRCWVKIDSGMKSQWAGNPNPVPISLLENGNYEIVNFSNTATGVINDEIYNTTFRAAVVPSSQVGMAVFVSAAISFKWTRQFDTSIFCSPAGSSSTVVIRLNIRKNNATIASAQMQVGNSQWGQVFTLQVPAVGDYAVAGDKYSVRLEIEGYLYDPDQPGNVYFHYQPGGFLKYAPSGYWKIGDTPQLNALLPEETQAEWVAKIVKAFDLQLATDANGVNVYCENRAGWLNALATPLQVDDNEGRARWQAAPRLEGNIERYTMLKDDKDKGQYTIRKNRTVSIRINNPDIMAGVVDYHIDFADTLFSGWMLRLYSQPLTYAGVPYTWGFAPRILEHAGTQTVQYRINGVFSTYSVPSWRAVDAETISQWHAARRLQLEIGKLVSISSVLSYAVVNDIIARGGMRTPIIWRGQQYYIQKIAISSASELADMTLMPLLPFSGEVGGATLPTSLPPATQAAAGGGNTLIISDNEPLNLS
jgi:hypothetical protein